MVSASCEPLEWSSKPSVSSVTDAIAATEIVVRSASTEEELTALEGWVRSLLAEILARLAELPADSRSQHRASAGLRLPSAGLQSPTQSPTHKGHVGDSPDALEEWYTDPWAMRKPRTSTTGSPVIDDIDASLNLAQLFSLHLKDDDVHTELGDDDDESGVDTQASARAKGCGGSFSKEAEKDTRWQYGRCGLAKLVTLSPPGCEDFEKILRVLMSLFDITQSQQDRLHEARPAPPRNWWSFEAPRCLAPRPAT